MKKLRKLEFNKFNQLSKEEARLLQGGISIAYSNSTSKYNVNYAINTGGITISSPTIRF